MQCCPLVLFNHFKTFLQLIQISRVLTASHDYYGAFFGCLPEGLAIATRLGLQPEDIG
jgi:hypothetical protein